MVTPKTFVLRIETAVMGSRLSSELCPESILVATSRIVAFVCLLRMPL